MASLGDNDPAVFGNVGIHRDVVCSSPRVCSVVKFEFSLDFDVQCTLDRLSAKMDKNEVFDCDRLSRAYQGGRFVGAHDPHKFNVKPFFFYFELIWSSFDQINRPESTSNAGFAFTAKYRVSSSLCILRR